MKQTLFFLFRCFIIIFLIQPLALIATDDCLFESTPMGGSNNEENYADGENDDLKSSVWQTSVYEIPVSANDGCVNGEAGSIVYEYVEMLTENKNIYLGFADLGSTLDISHDNLRVLPMAVLSGKIKQSCWVGSWCKCCQYNVDAFYTFSMPHKIPKEKIILKLIQPNHKIESLQDDASDKTPTIAAKEEEEKKENENGKKPQLIKHLLVPSSLDFSYSPGVSNRLFSLDIILNPNWLFSQLSEDIMQDLTWLAILENHPYLHNFYISIGREGTKPDGDIVVQFEPKDKSKFRNAQPLVEYFQGNEVLIPQCGKTLRISCANLDENQKMTITVTGELPPDLLPLIASLTSPFTDPVINGLRGLWVNELEIALSTLYSYCPTPVSVIRGVRFATASTAMVLNYIPRVRDFSFSKKMRNLAVREILFFNKFDIEVMQIVNSAVKGARFLSAWVGFEQFTFALCNPVESEASTPVVSEAITTPKVSERFVERFGVSYENGTVHSISLKWACRNNQGSYAIGKGRGNVRETLEKPLCELFCLGDEFHDERCQIARDGITKVFRIDDVKEHPSCQDFQQENTPINKPGENCLESFGKDTCSALHQLGTTKDPFCKLCNAAHDQNLRCQESISPSRSEVSSIAGSLESTHATSKLINTKSLLHLSTTTNAPMSPLDMSSTIVGNASLIIPMTTEASSSASNSGSSALLPCESIDMSPQDNADRLITDIQKLARSDVSPSLINNVLLKLSTAVTCTSAHEILEIMQEKILNGEYSSKQVTELIIGLNKLGFKSLDSAIITMESMTGSQISGESIKGIHELGESISAVATKAIIQDSLMDPAIRVFIAVVAGGLTAVIGGYCIYKLGQFIQRKHALMRAEGRQDEEVTLKLTSKCCERTEVDEIESNETKPFIQKNSEHDEIFLIDKEDNIESTEPGWVEENLLKKETVSQGSVAEPFQVINQENISEVVEHMQVHPARTEADEIKSNKTDIWEMLNESKQLKEFLNFDLLAVKVEQSVDLFISKVVNENYADDVMRSNEKDIIQTVYDKIEVIEQEAREKCPNELLNNRADEEMQTFNVIKINFI